MSKEVILYLVLFFCFSFLLMIPFYVWNKKLKKNSENFKKKNKGKAILHIYGSKVCIDGSKIKDLEYVKGPDLEYVVALDLGEHEIRAKYEASLPGLTKNKNYKTPKAIKSKFVLDEIAEYTLSIYFYSPEDRRNYYEGDVGEDKFCQVLDVSGSGFNVNTTAFIILYLENEL